MSSSEEMDGRVEEKRRNFENVPLELKVLAQWVLWKYEERTVDNYIEDNEKQLTKPPYQRGGRKASVMNPDTWATFDEVLEEFDKGGYEGIGFVFTENDPYVGIDLDVREDYAVNKLQMEIYNQLNSYSEISPGNGLHVICKGDIVRNLHIEELGFEIYSKARYFTMTGNVYNNVSIKKSKTKLNEICDYVIKHSKKNYRKFDVKALEEEQKAKDEEIIKACSLSLSSGSKFIKLWHGVWNEDYPTQSEADQAMINMLVMQTRNRDQIKRIFRASGLGQREKALREDYLNLTINKGYDRTIPPVDLSGIKKQMTIALATRVDKKTALPDPPGLTGEIKRFIQANAPRPIHEIAIAASIALMAGICGRAYNVSGTGLNHYILMLAPTGTGKEAMASGISKLVNYCARFYPNVREFLAASGDFASGQALYKAITEQPSSVVTIGEFGLKLQSISSSRANSVEIMLRRALLDLYHKSGKYDTVKPIRYSKKENNDVEEIRAPNLTICAESTPETFHKAIDEDTINSGLISRFLIVEYNGIRAKLNPNAHLSKPDEELVNKIITLAQYCMTTMLNDNAVDVGMSPDVEKLDREFDEYCDDQINSLEKDALRQLWNRAHLKVRKLAALLAVGKNHLFPQIDTECFEWAKELVVRDIKSMLEKVKTGELGGELTNKDHSIYVNAVEKKIDDYLNRPYREIMNYPGVNKELKENGIISYAYLQTTIARIACFRNNQRGSTIMLKQTLEIMKDSDLIVEVPREQVLQIFPKVRTGKYYARQIVWDRLLGERKEDAEPTRDS